MAELDPRLVGNWSRTTEASAANGYAAHLHFEAGGLYVGLGDTSGAFTWWDGGTWAQRGPGQLALSTANDAVITYAYALDADILTITDALGLRVAYRRDD
ncbi:hypothetical protein [Pseudomonas sp. LFM046]|uniref:hypothetical protein n=1 Tax=Pseudomonas sp. LFM046 TaxID=1608357 RepID=UPI0005CF9D67|nr:hypothetical protein [Pseudomonas sp. LFM046]